MTHHASLSPVSQHLFVSLLQRPAPPVSSAFAKKSYCCLTSSSPLVPHLVLSNAYTHVITQRQEECVGLVFEGVARCHSACLVTLTGDRVVSVFATTTLSVS